MIFKVEFTSDALSDIARLERSEPGAYKKVSRLLEELAFHPQTGTGHPKPLSGDRAGQWCRRIDKKHRLVYYIDEEVVVVLVLSAYGHYEDK